MPNNWTDSELKKAVKAYFKMLKYEQTSTPFTKVEISRELQKDLNNRSRSSIDYRWQNISAVLQDKKVEYLSGYKPLNNVGSKVRVRIWKIITDLDLMKSIK
jgi:5-methylcytosine-specific restriction enzyme A